MNEIGQRIEQFKDDRRHGASQLLSTALNILIDAAWELPISAEQSIISQLDTLAGELADARPGMVNINNVMIWYRKSLTYLDKYASVQAIRENAVVQTELIHNYCLKTSRTMIANAVRVINEGSTIITCSYSSTVSRTLIQAFNKGVGFSVLVLQSCWQDCCYGAFMHQEMKEAGIKSSLIEDAGAARYLSRADKVLLGADALFPDGTLINGYPSRELAMAAASFRRPVPVLALLETFKIARQEESRPIQDGFQAVPFGCLFGVVSEQGLHQRPAEIHDLAGRSYPEGLFNKRC